MAGSADIWKTTPHISQLFEQISQSFGYDYSTIPSAELITGFKHHLEQSEQGKTYTLIIDDAELLDEGALEAVVHLSQLHNDKGRLLRVVLFGSLEMGNTAILQTTPLRTLTIEPLDSEQSQNYINFCIAQRRYAIDQLPSENQQQQIVKRAEGIPARIEAMLQNAPHSENLISKILDWRVAALFLLILAAGIGYQLNRGDDKKPPVLPLASDKPVAIQQPVIRTAPVVSKPTVPTVSATKSEPAHENALISELLQQNESSSGDSVPLVENTVQTDGAVIDTGNGSEKQHLLEGIPLAVPEVDVEGSAETLLIESEPKQSLAINEESMMPQPDSLEGRVGDREWLQGQPATSFTIQLVAAGREAALDELISREQLHKELARFSFVRDGKIIHVLTQGVYRERSEAEEVIKSYSQAVRPWIRPIGDIHKLFKSNPPLSTDNLPTPLAAAQGPLKDSAWMWSQDPEMISIQLLAGGNREMLEPYMQQSLKIGTTAILESKRDSKPWYILLHGIYKTREEARSAITQLPHQLRSAKPWVRSFASVHDELSRVN